MQIRIGGKWEWIFILPLRLWEMSDRKRDERLITSYVKKSEQNNKEGKLLNTLGTQKNAYSLISYE